MVAWVMRCYAIFQYSRFPHRASARFVCFAVCKFVTSKTITNILMTRWAGNPVNSLFAIVENGLFIPLTSARLLKVTIVVCFLQIC